MPTLRRMYSRNPLAPRDMARRTLHSLRRNYAVARDPVRMIGALDRLHVLYDASEAQDPPEQQQGPAQKAERRKCSRQLVECILTLRDASRAPEARQLIFSLLDDPSGTDTWASEDGRKLERLLADPWLHEFSA